MGQKLKLLIDTDIGGEVEDAMALTLVVASGEAEVVGVTTVTGDTNFRAHVAKKILSLLGRKEVPVIPGIGNPKTMGGWEYNAFLDENEKIEVKSQITASDFIIESLSRNPKETTLVGIGPLTNIAKALDKDPSIVNKVKRLVLMGGIIKPPIFKGKQIPRGFEYNFCNDSLSAEKVLKAGFPLELLPGDITFHQRDPWPPEELVKLKRINHPAVKLLMRVNDIWMVEMRKNVDKAKLPLNFVQPWINDTLLMVYLLKPEFFETKEKVFKWQLPDKHPRFVESNNGIQMKIITKANYRATRKFLLKTFQKLSS